MIKAFSKKSPLFGICLLLLGAGAVLSSVGVNRWVSTGALDEDAARLASAWVDRNEARILSAMASRSGAALESLRAALDETRSAVAPDPAGRVERYALLNTGGVVALAQTGFDADIRAALAGDNRFAHAVARAVASGESQIQRLPHGRAGADALAMARVFVPLARDGGTAGVAVIDIDQANATALLQRTVDKINAAMMVLMVFGVGLPLAFVWRQARMRRLDDSRIHFLAMHDPLTRLPNRVQFKERLNAALTQARRAGGSIGVLCIDVDKFKEVNDTLGHTAGDALLVSVAERLRSSVRDSDHVGRLGGDEFAIVVADAASPVHLATLAQRLCRVLAEPHMIDGHAFCSSISIGIAVSPDDGRSADLLMRNADLALYNSKAEGRNTFSFFEPAMDNALRERSRMEQDLRRAVMEGELRLAYQPQFDLRSGKLAGYEALLRWAHPERGEISPGMFIQLAEDVGLIHAIGEWVLRTGCAAAAAWPGTARIAVNLSAAQFSKGDLVAKVGEILTETGLDPRRLELEIPEALLVSAPEAAFSALTTLQGMGVTVTIDDFGTGQSSLSHLSRFPFNKIKIDRTFVATLKAGRPTPPIINTIVGIGRSIGVSIAAEGVETLEQAEALRASGCSQVQGFLYGRPTSSVAVGEDSAVITAAKPSIRAVNSAA